MKKLKYILASVVLASSFASCETEPIDEKVKDDSSTGTPILSFDLNAKETVVTDKVTVGFSGDGISIDARLSLLNQEDTSNPETRYRVANLSIYFNSFVVGHFPTTLDIDNPTNALSSAVLEIQELEPDDDGVLQKVWYEYSTDNANEKQEAGFGNITRVNDTARYLHGNFDYILYPDPDHENTELEPQRLTNGNFKYINY